MIKQFIYTLIIINGIMIPIVTGVFLYKYWSDNGGIDYEATGIIVGSDLDRAARDSVALQGLSYDRPMKIYNSENFYLPISAKTFEEVRELSKDKASAGDFYSGWFNYINVLFLDENYEIIGRLLDKKASIEEIGILYNYTGESRDTTVRNISYMIGYEDTNRDGILNYLDSHDLYISDLNGKHLTRVTQEKDVLDYEFIKSNTEIFIQYVDRSNMRSEHAKTKFGLFRIASGEFKELNEIDHSLTEIESMLVSNP